MTSQRPARRDAATELALGTPDRPGRDIFAAAVVGRSMFLAADDRPTIVRLLGDGRGNYGERSEYAVDELVDLPEDGPVDIAALAADDDYLWIVGSHAVVRDRDDPTAVNRSPSRSLVACVPLEQVESGVYEPVRTHRRDGDKRRSAALSWKSKGRTTLGKQLERDDLIGPFVGLPVNDNGLAIGASAVRGSRMLLGLRGPVVGGRAVVIELDIKRSKKRRLGLRRSEDGGRYRRHLLDLDGLGIRGLAFDGDDVVVLANPSTTTAEPQRLYRWSVPETGDDSEYDAAPERLAELSSDPAHDRASAIARLDDGRILVGVADPHPDRLIGARGVVADVYDLSDIDDDPIDVNHAGGGWYDIKVFGIAVDRRQGATAAHRRADELRSEL